MAATYKVAVIGHTGRGDYGHGIDTVWRDLPQCKVVAVADADEKGLAEAVKRLGGVKGYGDYRAMLDEQKPDIVAVCPRWLDQHRQMVVACAERGAHMYMEKPLCRTLDEADAMVEACRAKNVKVAIAFQTRYSPRLRAVWELIHEGALGRILELRGRGKEDARGGGEDLWVLGSHIMNLMHHFGGEPTWCFAHVTEGGEPVAKKHVKEGREGIGPLAGDVVAATYALSNGATGYFNSHRNAAQGGNRFGLRIYGERGVIEILTGYLPAVHYLPDPLWSPGRSGTAWTPVSSAGVGKPEPLKDGAAHAGNLLACRDLIAAIEQDRQPEASIYEGRTTVEMIAGVFESHRVGAAVAFPLKNRGNPLAALE